MDLYSPSLEDKGSLLYKMEVVLCRNFDHRITRLKRHPTNEMPGERCYIEINVTKSIYNMGRPSGPFCSWGKKMLATKYIPIPVRRTWKGSFSGQTERPMKNLQGAHPRYLLLVLTSFVKTKDLATPKFVKVRQYNPSSGRRPWVQEAFYFSFTEVYHMTRPTQAQKSLPCSKSFSNMTV